MDVKNVSVDCFTIVDEVGEGHEDQMEDHGNNEKNFFLNGKMEQNSIQDVQTNLIHNEKSSEAQEVCKCDTKKEIELDKNVENDVEQFEDNNKIIITDEEEMLESKSSITDEFELQDKSITSDKSEVFIDSEMMNKNSEVNSDLDEIHPYSYLIDTFELPKDLLYFTTVGSIKSLNENNLSLTRTGFQFKKMLESLRRASEIAVDIHIADKEFREPICLISIATKHENYIIDALKLKNELLQLTEIFINPNIIKIIFCAEDILKHIQQKLHLYMVNIFDIAEARNFLGFKPVLCTLTKVLRKEYGFDRCPPSTQIDFNARPISDGIKTLCSGGVHYMIYLYHDYKNKLLSRGEAEHKVFLKWCREACKKIYSSSKKMELKSLIEELVNRHNCEIDVLKKMFHMRNAIAKRHNVKPEAVISRSGIMTLVKKLPTEGTYVKFSNIYLRDEWYKIKRAVLESKEKFNIPDLNSKKNKKSYFAKPNPNIINRQPKRKLRSYDGPPQKQLRHAEPPKNNSPRKKRKSFEHNKNKQKHAELQKKSKFSQDTAPQNNKKLNIPSLVNNTYYASPFLNQSKAPFNNSYSNDGFNSIRQNLNIKNLNNRPQNMINPNSFNMTPSNEILINPTNIPASMPFQSQTFTHFNNTNTINEERTKLQTSSRISNIRSSTAEEDELYRSLVDLKQARDNIQRQRGNYSNYYPNRIKDFKTIDQEISRVERQVQDIKNSRQRNNNLFHRRRY